MNRPSTPLKRIPTTREKMEALSEFADQIKPPDARQANIVADRVFEQTRNEAARRRPLAAHSDPGQDAGGEVRGRAR